jgi:hypothetical protein
MRNTLLLFASIALTVLCWGLYGPVLYTGRVGMSNIQPSPAWLRPFVCVGLAYCLIGVVVPSLWLYILGEKGDWTLSGIIWSFAGGAVGAIGALGIILAMTYGGSPIYVMPLVFGGAPVVNAFLTIYLARRIKEIGPVFLAGLIIVAIGAVVVIVFAPHAPTPANEPVDAAQATADSAGIGFWTWISQLLSIALTIVCWGAYGPVLHKGQAAMHHSRMRPLICVGLAYFFIAVVVPNMILAEAPEESTYASWGTFWALAAGAFGAAGALGIIMSFNAGGRPVFVMPLVFGGAPVVSSMYTVTRHDMWGGIHPFFWAGLILVIAGAVIVLVFAPRGEGGRKSRVEGREPEPRKIEEPEANLEASGTAASEP